MGRNSKKNKGRKPVAEQGLKGVASASTNVTAAAPSRPARTETHNAADILKIEQKGAIEQPQRLNVWQQEDEKPKGVDADKFASISMAAMENKEIPQRAAGIGHSPQIVAVPDVKGPCTSLLTCLYDKLEVSGLLHEQDVEAQADDTSIGLKDGAIQENIPPQQVSHLKQDSLLETETSCGDSNSDPAIARKEQDFMDAEPVASVQRTSWSETTVVDVSVTFCTSSDNLNLHGQCAISHALQKSCSL